MTISSETNYTKLEGDGATTAFSFTFYIADADHLLVTHIDSSGTETVLTKDTDYSVAGVGDAAGGTVVYPLSGTALPEDEYLYMQRNIPFTQTTDYDSTTAPFPNTIESDQDRLIMLMQQIQETLNRVPTLGVGSSVTAEDLLNDILLNYGSMTGTGKGDMIVFNGTSWQVVDAGTTGYFLKANSAATGGVEWAEVTGAVAADHSTLANLSADDHTQYARTDGSRAITDVMIYAADESAAMTDDKHIVSKKFVDDNYSATGHTHSDYVNKDGSVDFTAKVSYDDDKTFSDDKELVAKKYVDDKTWDHNEDTLSYSSETDDLHTIYIKHDGTRAFTGKVSGITPTLDAHLATKGYVDSAVASITRTISIVSPSATAASNRHVLYRADRSVTTTYVYSVMHSDSPGGTEEIEFDVKYGNDLSSLTTAESITCDDMSVEGSDAVAVTLSDGDYLLIDITSVTGGPENLVVSFKAVAD